MRVCERGNCDLFPRCRYIFMSLLFGNFRAAAFPRPLDIWRVRKTHFPRMENWFGPPIFSVFIFRAGVDRHSRVRLFCPTTQYVRIWKGIHAFQTLRIFTRGNSLVVHFVAYWFYSISFVRVFSVRVYFQAKKADLFDSFEYIQTTLWLYVYVIWINHIW